MPGKFLLVCGEDTFLAQRQAQALVEAALPADARDLGLEVVEAASSNAEDVTQAAWRAVETVQTMGFFGGGKLVWLRHVDPLFSARTQQPKAVAETAEALTRWIAGNPLPDTHVLLVQAQNVSRTSMLYKALVKAGEVHDFKVGDRPHELQQHAMEQLDGVLRQTGLRMPGEMRSRFIERVGTATWRIVSEVEKLDLFLMPERNVTEAAILEATSMGSLDAAWDLTDAFGARDLTGTLTALRRLLAQRLNVIGLTTQLETRVRDLLLYREAMDRGWLRVSDGGGMSRSRVSLQWQNLPANIERAFAALRSDPRKTNLFFAGRLAVQAQCFTLRELRNARHLLITARERMVSTGLAPEMLLELALSRILVSRRQPVASRGR